MSAGDRARRQVNALVPEGVKAGETQLSVDIGDGEKLTITVPEAASPGDLLTFYEADDAGTWRCSLERAGGLGTSSGSGDAGRPRAPEPRAVCGELQCTVPDGVVPGTTKLRLTAGAISVVALVPEDALPGDQLSVTVFEGGAHEVRILQRHVLCPAEVPVAAGSGQTDPVKYNVTLTRLSSDPHELYESMVAVAEAAGARISRKLARGAAPPLHILGMVTREHIEQGEELARMPTGLILSISRCREVFPRLAAAVEALRPAMRGREPDAMHAACLAALLRVVEARNRASPDGDALAPAPVGGSCPEAEPSLWPAEAMPEAFESGPHASALRLWACYAEALLCESFEDHPYWRVMHEPQVVERFLSPSREREYMSMMAGDVVAMYQCLAQRVPTELIGSRFDLGIFLQARLSILTRVFQLNGESCLVPLNDFFNHAAVPSVTWQWDAEREDMVLVAARAHKAGEALSISYGKRSNVLLFRTYGFTLPPEEEPAWTYIVQGTARPADVFARFLPPEQARLTIHLETKLVQNSLVQALNACKDFGTDPEAFLRALCERCIEPYTRDEALQPALEALQRARALDPRSGAWWAHMDPDAAATRTPWAEHALRVKMSEYLCLTVHLEMLGLLDGTVTEEQCLADASEARTVLKEGMEILRSDARFTLNTVDKGNCQLSGDVLDEADGAGDDDD